MDVKGYHILSLEANDIYRQEQVNGVQTGYVLPAKKDKKYFKAFKNIFDNSLDLIELEKKHQDICRKNFCREDEYHLKYTLAIINVKFTYNYKPDVGQNDWEKSKDRKQLREHFYTNGFNLNGVHYVRYKRSSGSSRQGKCLFINEKLLNHMSKWGECGLDSQNGDLASWEAYKALSLSSIKGTINIPLEGILFIQDSESEFLEEVVSVEEQNDALIATTKETVIKNDIWDGESLLDESLFAGDYADKHMLLLRNKFFKSCGFKTKLQKWFEDKNVTIDDLKERGFITLATDINQIVMVTTPSSMKFLKFMGNNLTERNVRKWIEKVDSTFGVVKYDKRTKFFGGKMVQTSYQFINTLGFSDEQVTELLKPSGDYLTTIRDDYDFMRYHFNKAYKSEIDSLGFVDDEEPISERLAERSDVIFKLMNVNYGFADTKLCYNFRNEVVENQKERLKQGHILLPGTNATLFGNGPEMLYALSGEFDVSKKDNESTVLGLGEIACKKFVDGEKLVCARYPHITMGNLYCATNNLSNAIWEYFDLGENIVCVNAIGENIQQRLNGCDYDSDAMLITNDSLVIKTAFAQKDLFKVPVCAIPHQSKQCSLWELDYNTSENKIGEIVNLSQKLNSILWDELNKGSSFEDVQSVYEDACKLAVLSGIEIDKAKRSYGNVHAGKEVANLMQVYGKEKPFFFKKIHEAEIEKRVRKIKDSDKVKQAILRKEERDKLRAKKEYCFYLTAMEYVFLQADAIDKRKGKPKKIDYRPILDMLTVPVTKTSTDYEHKKKVIEICERYSKELESLYALLEKAKKDKEGSSETDAIYLRIQHAKADRKEEVEKVLDTEYVLYLVIKDYENNESENWHLYAPVLDSELFLKMLKNSKEKMRTVVESEDGEYDLYGLKFAKI